MSQSKFFSIGHSIFNKDAVIAVHQDKRKIEVELPVAVVTVMEGNESREHVVYLPADKTVADYVKAYDINILD